MDLARVVRRPDLENSSMRLLAKTLPLIFIVPIVSNVALGADVSSYSLTKAVPADVFVCVAARHNPKHEFVDQYYAKVFDSFMRSGVCDEIWKLISDNASKEDMQRMEEFTGMARKLLARVRWSEIFSQEMVFMGRVG